MTPYQNIYDRFELKITDFDLAGLVLANKLEIEEKLLLDAIPQYTEASTDLSDRNSTSKQFNQTLTEVDEMILSLYMVRGWISPYLNTQDLLENALSTQEYNAFSPSAKITAIRELYSQILKDVTYLTAKAGYKKLRGKLR
jgi:hypothetical protein